MDKISYSYVSCHLADQSDLQDYASYNPKDRHSCHFHRACPNASPRHLPSSSQAFSHVQTQQCLCSDPSSGCYGYQLVAHKPGHTATPGQKELCDGRPKTRKAIEFTIDTTSFFFLLQQSCCKGPGAILIKKVTEVLAHLLGSAEKLEKTYRAIMSRQVSVSSRWTVFSPSSA